MIAIGVYQLLINKHDGKCYYQQQYKAILGLSMSFATKGLTENSRISNSTPIPVKNPSAIKVFCQKN